PRRPHPRRSTLLPYTTLFRSKGQLPPSTRRGVVLMDPSYEGHGDYGRVVATLRDALHRFAEGVYIVWYPQVQKLEAAQLPKRLEDRKSTRLNSSHVAISYAVF